MLNKSGAKSYQMDMCTGSILKKMLIFSLPLMASSMLQLLFNAADIIVVGRFAGDNALAAVGSNTALINLLTNFFMGLSIGANVLVARYFGVISMITLMLKGVLTISAAYLLASTTPIEKICAALRHLHFPKMIVTVILLIYRYMSLLMSEASRMTQAYMLRAPGHKGIHIKAWGSFAGNLLIRSIDKAKTVYDSMILRGFDGEINYTGYKKMSVNDYVYMMAWFVVLLVIRTFM